MEKVLNANKQKGSKSLNEPKLAWDIASEMLQSNSNLAKGYRQFLASKTNAEKGGAL